MNLGLTHRDWRLLQDLNTKANPEQRREAIKLFEDANRWVEALDDKSLSEWQEAQEMAEEMRG